MMTLPFHFRRLIHCSLLLCLIYIAAQIVWSQRGMGYLDDIDREARLKEISRMLQPSQQQTWRKLVGGGQACRHPHLEVHNRDIMKFIKPVPPIDCGEKTDWVQINGSTAFITDQARSRHGDIECAFTDIIRSNDHAVHDGITTQTHTEYNLEESDFVKVHCKSSQGDVWHNVMAGVRHDQDVLDRTGWDKVSSDNLHLNVLIWGFDSLSHNMFIRKMPRSYHYMRDTLQAIELHGYNIVGDGTPQALIPILTDVEIAVKTMGTVLPVTHDVLHHDPHGRQTPVLRHSRGSRPGSCSDRQTTSFLLHLTRFPPLPQNLDSYPFQRRSTRPDSPLCPKTWTVIPSKVGKTELELPETRKRMGDKASYVNVYPFMWKEYQEKGYVTAYLEDCPTIGTFTYRLKGFDAQPTDHYMRPYYMAASSEYTSHKKFCMGSVPRHKVMMDYIHNLYRVYRDKPKFMFAFHGELSHDSYNQIGATDQDMLDWLTTFKEEGHLNNTLLVMMSDHGHRFMDIRNTQQGKQEERMPMFAFVFPPWFERAYPDMIGTFKNNAHRLTTPFDINPTLRDILHFQGGGKGDIRNRSISLFKEIPLERTCSDAYIEPHWCACLDWEEVSLEDSIVRRAARAFVDFLNKYTSEYRKLCASLRLERVQWAAHLVPNKGLLDFRRNADLDGFVADLTAHTDITQTVYQLKVATVPGGGLFEVSVRHDIGDNSFTIRVSDISRINRYGSSAHCVEDSAEHLRKYCYCKTLVKKDP
uniref:Uncharacterized protein n=1 Tax=Timema douglasi TaxID=61478 RepID=A0A7R8VHX8_TIMDO|nr:unnamed protein product [Timema douglasi]